MINLVLAGYDEQGRPLYRTTQPLDQIQMPIQQTMSTPKTFSEIKQKVSKSIFDIFFIVQDGLISYSLKSTTIIVGLTIISILLGELYYVCSTGARDCSPKVFPTISKTIITYEEFNKIFLVSVTLFSWAVVSSIVRSFYKMLHGVISVGTNNTYMAFGYVIVASFPLIGIFDC